MKLFRAIAGIFSTKATQRDLFDSEKGHLKRFGKWIDNSQFTEQEMAELDAEVAVGVRKFAVETLSENTERSKARRDVALLTVRSFFLFLFLSGITYKIDSGWSAVWLSLATNHYVGALVLGVVAFFFGVHTLRVSKDGAKKE